MNKFLFAQLNKKVEKFFEGKSDLFVVGANQWLSYGGALQGPAKEMSDEEFEYLKKELIGDKLLADWLSDMKGESQYFSKMSLSDRDYMQNLHVLFADECYQRLRKVSYKDKLKKLKRQQAYFQKKKQILMKEFLNHSV